MIKKYRDKLSGQIVEAIHWESIYEIEEICAFAKYKYNENKGKFFEEDIQLSLNMGDYICKYKGNVKNSIVFYDKKSFEKKYTLIEDNTPQNFTELKNKLKIGYIPNIHNLNKVEMFKELTDKMVEIYKSKNKDYNDSFGESYRKDGILGIKTAVNRIGDKFNRLDNYAQNLLLNFMLGNFDNDILKVKDEKIEDTLLDMANYCIMTLIEMKLMKM